MHYWTVAEARAFLPRLRDLLAAVQRVVAPGVQVRGNGKGRVSGGAGSGPADAEADARAAMAELEEAGIVVRDPTVGLVDFPALGSDGVVYLLCFRLDDDDLAWWHLPEEGFSGRRPLPLPDDI